MRKPDRIVYLDADVIISFLGAHPQRMSTIETFFDEVSASKGATQLVTSVVSQAEISFLLEERDAASFQPGAVQAIDDFWRDESLVSIVELDQTIALAAREVQRLARSQGRKPLKPMDALHLATARWVGASQLFTYNTNHFSPHEQWAGLKVLEPYVNQARLTGL